MAASNVHISTHPCLRAKLSQLRSKDANARETKALIHEIALILAVEALASELTPVNTGTVSLATLVAFRPSGLCMDIDISAARLRHHWEPSTLPKPFIHLSP